MANWILDGLKLELQQLRNETSELRTQNYQLFENMNKVTNSMETKLVNLLNALSQMRSPNSDHKNAERRNEEE